MHDNNKDEKRKNDAINSKLAEGRNEGRTPLVRQKKDTFDKDPNFRYHVVNEGPGAIEAHIRAGWELVNSSDKDRQNVSGGFSEGTQMGSVTRFVVNKNVNTPDRYGVLMRKRQDWFDEDKKLRAERYNRIDRELDPRTSPIDGVETRDFSIKNGSKDT